MCPQAYGRAKAKFGLVSGIWGQAKEMAIIYYDLYPKLWSLAGLGLTYILPANWRGEITQSLLFIFAYSFAETIISLPFSYYHTFVLEEHYGFNKQTLGLWITDMLKGQALGIAFGVPLGSAFLAIIKRTGDVFFYYIWLFMLAVQIIGVTIYPVFIVPLFNKLTPLEPGPLREKVEALAAKLNFPLSELQVIDGSKRSAHSNAYFTGLPFLKKKIVLYDTLLEKSEDREVEAVLAHELGHWSLGHVPRLLLISQVQTFYIFLLFSVFIRNKSMYTDFGFTRDQPIIIGLILFNGILSPTDPVIQLLMHMLTRKYEYEAGSFPLLPSHPHHHTNPILNLCRCLLQAPQLLLRPRPLPYQTADPEPLHYGRRLGLLELPLLAPDPDGAPACHWLGATAGWCCGGEQDGRWRSRCVYKGGSREWTGIVRVVCLPKKGLAWCWEGSEGDGSRMGNGKKRTGIWSRSTWRLGFRRKNIHYEA